MTVERFLEIKDMFNDIINGQAILQEYLIAVDRIKEMALNRSNILFENRNEEIDAIIKKHTDAIKEEVETFYNQHLSALEKQFGDV